jgi:chemotaxis protein MotB
MARQRRKVLMDANNHDRWIVSYADFITLLFAFFVVMYSVSSVNQGKYRSLTESLGTAFSNKTGNQKTASAPNLVQGEPLVAIPLIPKELLAINFEFMALLDQKTPEALPPLEPSASPALSEPAYKVNAPTLPLDLLALPFESVALDKPPMAEIDNMPAVDKQAKAPDVEAVEPTVKLGESSLGDLLAIPFEALEAIEQTDAEIEKTRELSAELLKEIRQLHDVSGQLESALQPFIADDLVSVKRNDYWIELEMNSELLFLSGEAALSPKAQPALVKIAEVVNTLPNAINVEGHTDNVPIGTPIFPSNWELSSARATSVVQELIKAGINPTRLSAVGYGEFHPIGDNTTDEGRFKNRRVTLVLMSQAFSRYGANDEERAKLLNLAPTTDADAPQP